ncbi:MAG TPA: hypothetical protein VHO90_15600, partial [Bacteroidales bacterium]|nr:hypothetical protein [Bacteroidales bacterium]
KLIYMSKEYIISLALIIFVSNNCVAQDLASVLTRHNQVTGYSVLEKVVTVCIEGEIDYFVHIHSQKL